MVKPSRESFFQCIPLKALVLQAVTLSGDITSVTYCHHFVLVFNKCSDTSILYEKVLYELYN